MTDHGTHLGELRNDTPDIVISSKELPEVAAWKNRQKYKVTINYTELIQSKRVELEDGEVLVHLRPEAERIVDGELA